MGKPDSPATPGGDVLADLRNLPTPEPMPNTATYEAERERCLAADPRRRANYERYMASKRRSAEVDYLPIKLDIENVSRCNFRCQMCQVSEWPKGQRADDLPLDAFKRLIDEQYGLVEIKLQGMGEPLLQRDAYFDMIRYARDRHIWVRTTTNASLLHLHNNYAKLIDSGVNEVQISIDGATEATFQAIRRGSVFGQVVENCKRINAYCRERNIERTKMWTVVQRDNWADLPALVALGAEMGFTSLCFSLNLSDFGQQEWRERNDGITMERHFDPAQAWQLIELGKKAGIQVRFWNVTSKYSSAAPGKLCPWPFERAFVSSDLRVVPCCVIAQPEVADLGDARTFTAAWTSAEFQAFRQAHLDGNIPSYCRMCYE